MARLSADERRQQIIEAALPLYANKGLNAVTTKDVAEAAGVSEALLYRHFSGRDALYQAVTQYCIDHATAPVDLLERLPNDTETLVLCVYAMMWNIQNAEEGACFRKLVHASLLTDAAFYKEFLAGTSTPWVAKMKPCVEAAIAAGDIDTEYVEAELCLWLAHHMSVTICQYKLTGVDIVNYPKDSRLLEQSVAFTLRGMGMTKQAIQRCFKPETFALLLQSKT